MSRQTGTHELLEQSVSRVGSSRTFRWGLPKWWYRFVGDCSAGRRHKPDLHTFSIGFQDEPFYDETQHARFGREKIEYRPHRLFTDQR